MNDFWQSSVVLITSSADDNSVYGTGFVAHRDEQGTYVLTCTHVVNDIGGKEFVKVDGIPATVIVSSSADDTDVAVLRVAGLADRPRLRLHVNCKRGVVFEVAGYYHLDDNPKKKLVRRQLRGILNDSIQAGMTSNTLVTFWEMEITGNDELRPGNSGSPVVDENNYVIGVVNTRLNANKKRGWVTPIEALEEVWPNMPPDLFIQSTGGIVESKTDYPHAESIGEPSLKEAVGEPLLPQFLARHEAHQVSTDLPSSEGLSQTLIHSPLTAVEDGIPPFGERIYTPQSKNSRKRRLLISTAILLVLAVSLVPFLPLPACSFAFCHSSPQPTQQSSSQQEGETRDQNLSVELVAVVSPSFVLPDDPKHYSGGITPPTSISAVLLPKNTSTYDTIIINVQNLRYGGADIFIDYVALKLLSIPALPQPLRVWTPGVATTYIGYPYPVTYKGQQQGQLLYAEPPKPVILTPAGPNHTGETDPLSLQIMSTVTAYLRFQVEITYQITGPEQTLILPQIFQVVFSDASNWQEEIL
jgi:hypothetical protein